MARHSKWHNIKKRKGAQDAKRGKIFTIHAKLVALAAQSGGDPEKNPRLAEAIIKAKADNVPNDNIDRAIRKGTGEEKGAQAIMELTYEGYGPGGVAIIVKALTDNKNRTAPNMRHIFSKFGGNMGESGSVSWIFTKKGVQIFDIAKYDKEKIEELVFETEAEDLKEEEGILKIISEPENLSDIYNFFTKAGYDPEYSGIDYIYDTESKQTEFDNVLKLTKMLEAFEDDEDVEEIYCNAFIEPELQEKVDAFIEEKTFRT